MLWLSMHGFAQIHEVHENSLFGTLTKDLRRPHDCPTLFSSKFRIVLAQNIEYPVKKLFIFVITISPLPRISSMQNDALSFFILPTKITVSILSSITILIILKIAFHRLLLLLLHSSERRIKAISN
eukprot:Gb_32347 [translate_table: standard]